MFEKVEATAYPPKERPLLIWDGQCGFCAYWVGRLAKITGQKVDYEPFQDMADDFPDIDSRLFAQAVRYIEPSGKIYSGPRAAYRILKVAGKWKFLDKWYVRSGFFRWISDHGYQFISKYRPFFFKLTRAFFGANPQNVRPFWAVYLCIILYILYISYLK